MSDTLADDYPFLSVVGTYRVLGYAALSGEAQIANQLRNYLSHSALAADGFALYKVRTCLLLGLGVS